MTIFGLSKRQIAEVEQIFRDSLERAVHTIQQNTNKTTNKYSVTLKGGKRISISAERFSIISEEFVAFYSGETVVAAVKDFLAITKQA